MNKRMTQVDTRKPTTVTRLIEDPKDFDKLVRFEVIDFSQDEKTRTSLLTLREVGNKNHTRVIKNRFSEKGVLVEQSVRDILGGGPRRLFTSQATLYGDDINKSYASKKAFLLHQYSAD